MHAFQKHLVTYCLASTCAAWPGGAGRVRSSRRSPASPLPGRSKRSVRPVHPAVSVRTPTRPAWRSAASRSWKAPVPSSPPNPRACLARPATSLPWPRPLPSTVPILHPPRPMARAWRPATPLGAPATPHAPQLWRPAQPAEVPLVQGPGRTAAGNACGCAPSTHIVCRGAVHLLRENASAQLARSTAPGPEHSSR